MRVQIMTKVFYLALVAVGLAPLAFAETVYKVTAHNGVEVLESTGEKALPPADEIVTTDTIEFSIRYDDVNTGFQDPTLGAIRRARFHDALEYVSEALGLVGELDVQVDASQSDGVGFLAVGGTFFSVSAGFQKATSLRRLESPTSVKPFADFEEVNMVVDFGHDWHFGLDAPPAGKVDFLSTMVHELTHGMGFVSLLNGDATSDIGPNIFSFYDQFLGNRSTGANFLNAGASVLVSAATLNSNVMGYVNATSTTVYNNGGLRIPMFSPGTFQDGSSFSHVDVGTVAGNPVMTHVVNTGVIKRLYDTADLGVMRVIGFATAVADPGTLSFDPTGGPTISVSPAGTINFGNVDSGATGNRTVTVQNTGGGTLTGSVGIIGVGFSVVGSPNFSLAAGASKTFTLAFTSLVLGLNPGTVTISSNASADIIQNLSANVVAGVPPAISVNPAGAINFGDVDSGATGNETVTVQNTGGGTLTGSVGISGAGFSIVGSTTFSLAGGASKTFTLAFSSVTLGLSAGTLTISSNAGANITRNLSGNVLAVAPPAIGVSPTGTIDFGDVDSGAIGNKTVAVQNTGGGTLTGSLSVSGAGISITGTPTFSLAAGVSKTFTIAFTSTTKGEATGTLTIGSNAGANISLALIANVLASSPLSCGTGNGSGGSLAGDAMIVLLCLLGLGITGFKPRFMKGS